MKAFVFKKLIQINQSDFYYLNKYIKSLCTLENIAFTSICCISVFAYSNDFNDMYITPKWLYVYLFTAIFATLICIKFSLGYSLKLNLDVLTNEICIICIIEALYGLLQYYNNIQDFEHPIFIGSFDNPAGFDSCLCFGLPFLLWHAKKSNKAINRWFYIIGIFIVLFAILISHSRTGIITALATLLIIGLHNFQKDKFIKFLVFIFIIIAITTFCYFLKKDSADGRLLIWRCSLDMFLDKPLFGHGFDSFRKYYMYYQADYFYRNPNSILQQLADSVHTPFNEYIRLLVNFGVVGCSIAIISIYLLFKRCRLHLCVFTLSIMSIAIFSFTSYPFSYPFTWIIFIFSFINILPKFNYKSFKIKNLAIIIMAISLYISYKTIIQIISEKEWHQADITNQLYLYNDFKQDLFDNPYFLYNFSAKLYGRNQLEHSLDVAIECRKHFADYDLEFLLGNIYMKQHNYDMAIKKYILCTNMCPSRFLPYSQLLQLYIETGNNTLAYKTALLINNKPIKISTPIVHVIKRQAKIYLNTHKEF